MKKLSIVFALAVAFILSAVCAEAKVYHFEINGVPHVAYYKTDGTLFSGEVTAEYHAKFKRQVPQQQTLQPSSPIKAVQKDNKAAIAAKEKNVQCGNNTPQTSSINIPIEKKQAKKSIQATVPSGNTQIQSAQIKKSASPTLNQVQSPASLNNIISNKTISAPKSIGALNSIPKKEVKKGETHLERANKFLAEINGEVPTKHGQEKLVVKYFPFDENHTDSGRVVRQVSENSVEILDDNGHFRVIKRPLWVKAEIRDDFSKPELKLVWSDSRPDKILKKDEKGRMRS